MRLVPIVLVLAAGLLLAACGGGEPGSPTQPVTTTSSSAGDTPAIAYDPDPGSVVVDVSQPLGGFVPAEISVDHRPQFRLYGDGTVIALPSTSPLGGFPVLETYRLSADGIDWVLEQARAEGLLAPAPDYGQPAVTDVGTVTVTLTAGGVQVDHAVYGPGFEDEPAAGLTAGQVEARKAFARFVDAVVTLPATQPELVDEPVVPYAPGSVAVWAWELPADVEGVTVADWPLSTPIGAEPPDPQSGARCFVVTGADVAALEEAFGIGEGLGRAWQSGTTDAGAPLLWSVGLDPVLPGDPGCPAGTGG